MCDGHAVVCMRDPEIFVWGGGVGGEPASTEKGRYFLYIVSRGKVRTSILWKPTGLVIFEVGRGSAH